MVKLLWVDWKTGCAEKWKKAIRERSTLRRDPKCVPAAAASVHSSSVRLTCGRGNPYRCLVGWAKAYPTIVPACKEFPAAPSNSSNRTCNSTHGEREYRNVG